ncbi:MAG: aminopeptidase [Candidatus Bipolaricaulota bacterium]|nr:aminopeptidase [Candidatus Bipolaricaulota bacterium]
MHDVRLDKLADVLVNYSAELQPGEKALINGTTETLPLAQAVARSVLSAGGHPYIRVTLPELNEYLVKNGSDDQLRHVPRAMVEAYAEADKTFNLATPSNLPRLLGAVSADRRGAFFQGQQAFRDKLRAMGATAGRRDDGPCSGCSNAVITAYPTIVGAEHVGMTLREYEDFVFDACLPDPEDPVGYWRAFHEKQQQLVDALNGTSALRVVAEDTDFRLSIAGRSFVNASGQSNMPDGEIFVGPIEGSFEGRVAFSLPTFWEGKRIEGMRLEFKKGRVVKASAAVNDAALEAALSTDEGARNVGEFAIGTNRGIREPIGDCLFDEKVAGTFHIALGAGLAGNTNVSMIHWDVVSDLRQGGEIYADDRLIYRDGEFLI